MHIRNYLLRMCQELLALLVKSRGLALFIKCVRSMLAVWLVFPCGGEFQFADLGHFCVDFLLQFQYWNKLFLKYISVPTRIG